MEVKSEPESYGYLSYENLSGLSSQDPFRGQICHTPNHGNNDQWNDHSPNSSASSSPKSRAVGNRARASSLNSKFAAGRSTAHITQQQINKKRQRATAEQLAVLEEAFETNPSPNAKVRESISARISMTERSVQIWFQNRRAKNKMMHKRPGVDDIGFRHASYNGRPGPIGRSYSIDHGLLSANGDDLPDPAQVAFPETLVTRINCRSLTIGTWRRVACTSSDLVCYFAHNEPKFTYYIKSGSSGYMIEYHIASIVKIDLRYLNTPGIKEMGRAVISLNTSPIFFMEIPSNGEWKRCTDFTENQQATTDLNHAIVGPYENLRQSFNELIATYKDMVILMTGDEAANVGPTPDLSSSMLFNASVPSDAQPLPALIPAPMNNSSAYNGKLQMPEPTRVGMQSTHRRTRSRSAPIAIDLSFMTAGDHEPTHSHTHHQQRSRADSYLRYGIDNNYTRHHGVEYSDGFCTPTTAATSNFQDQWYTPSYATTPLLGADSSQLGSPIIPTTAQFDLNTATSHLDPYHAFPSLTNHLTTMTTALPQHLTPAQALPETGRLDSVPEIPMAGDGQFLVHPAEQMVQNPLDLSQASFLPTVNSTHLHDLLPQPDQDMQLQ